MSEREASTPDPSAPLIDHAAYSFQIALTDAISRYVRELRRTQFRALTYRGVDLGRAIAVELYFRLVNDDTLLVAYRRHLHGERFSQDKDDIPLATEAYWIFRQIIRRAPPGYLHRRLKAYVKLTYEMGPNHLDRQVGKAGQQKKGPFLILALSKRFFDYLLPVRRALDAEVRWLVPADNAWAAEAAATGEQFIFFSGEVAAPSGRLTEPLDSHWKILASRFDQFLEILKATKPSAVVVTEGNQANDEILARAAQSAGVRSVCIQQGWSPIVHTGFRDMHYDAFCVWGPEFAKLLQPYNRHQAFVATGSHQVGLSNPFARPENGIAFFLQKSSLLITQRAWDEMFVFILWVARAWPDRRVLVRAHPKEPLTERETAALAQHSNIILCPSPAMTLDEVLRQTAIAVAFYSTTLVEALAHGAVPLVINITGAPHYNPDLAALGAGVEVHDFEAGREAMRRHLSGEDEHLRRRIPSLVSRFFCHPSDVALQNIASAITPRC